MDRKYIIGGVAGSILLMIVIVLGITFFKINNQSDDEVNLNISITSGQLLEIKEHEDEKTISVKVKVEEQETVDDTINQNLDNLKSIINAINTTKYNNLYYYAVADIDNKQDIPILSFTLSKNDIEDLKKGIYEYKQALALADDLWIYPSLAKDYNNEEIKEASTNESNTNNLNIDKSSKSTVNSSNKNTDTSVDSSNNTNNSSNNGTNDSNNSNDDNFTSTDDNIVNDDNSDNDIIIDEEFTYDSDKNNNQNNSNNSNTNDNKHENQRPNLKDYLEQ